MLAHQYGCWLRNGVLQALTQGRGPPALAEALYSASGDLPHGSLEPVQSRLDPVDVALESAGGAAQVRGLWTTLVSMVVNLTVHRVRRSWSPGVWAKTLGRMHEPHTASQWTFTN